MKTNPRISEKINQIHMGFSDLISQDIVKSSLSFPIIDRF